MSTNWREIAEVFDESLDVPPDERSAWLAIRCGSNQELLREVVSLLEAEVRSEGFLAPRDLIHSVGTLITAEEEPSRDGERVGSFRIVREIGRGGMGVVYLAEREDDQFRQQVAIKLVKRGMDTDDVLRRFRNERRILASLNHPNIARMFDGGSTEDGLPYFVMEFIDGVSITEYCASRSASIAERLQLFRTVCAAVQHAHQNLVIHRDLKPSNILVTGDGQIKLLDFGVAKLLSPDPADDASQQTRTRFRALTLEYAGPEQVRGDRITTATDTYSLGVILYELLSGARPYQLASGSPETLSRLICEIDPPKPSDAAARVPNSSANSRALRGDLDNVVLMAMRKDPARRYPSVEQFSSDVERYLKGLPLIAHKDNLSYRASKFTRRNKAGIAAAVLITAATLAGLVGTTWQARAAREQRDRANEEKLKAQAVNAFLQRILRYTSPFVNRKGKSTSEITMAEALDAAATRLDGGEFSSQPEVRAELELVVGEAYSSLGRYDVAVKHFKRFVALQTELYAEDDPRNRLADAYRARIAYYQGDTRTSEKLLRRALPALREEQAEGRMEAGLFAEILTDFAVLRRTQGDPQEAELLFREILELKERIPSEQQYYVVVAGATLASAVADQGRFDDALAAALEAVTECRRNGSTQQPEYGYASTIYGGFLSELGDFEQADRVLLEGESVLRKTGAPSSLWLGDNLRNQAISLYQQGRYGEALARIRETRSIYDPIGKQYDHYPTALIVQGLSLARTGHALEGERLVRDALQIRVESLPPDHYFTSVARGALGECLLIQDRFEEAAPLLRDAYEQLKNSQGKDNPRTRLAGRRLVALRAQRIDAPP